MLALLLSRRGHLRRGQLDRVPLRPARSSRAPTYTAAADVEAILDEARAAPTCSSCGRARWRRRWRELGDRPRRPTSAVRLPGHPRRRRRGARADPRLAHRRRAASSSTPTASCSPGSGEDATAAASPSLPLIDDRRAASAGLSRRAARSPAIDLDAATRLASLVPGRRRQRGATAWTSSVNDANGFILRGATRPTGRRSSATTRRACARPSSSPGQVRLLRSLLLGREGLIERIVLASETDGTYIPKPTPKPTPTATPAP